MDFLPPGLSFSYYQELFISICKENDENCSHWLDKEIYSKLKEKDLKDDTNEAETYFDNSFYPNIQIIPVGKELEVKSECRKMNIVSVERCPMTFDKSLKLFTEEINRIWSNIGSSSFETI